MNKQQYKEYAEGRARKSKIVPDCIRAFLVGGVICLIGEGLFNLYKSLGLSEYQTTVLVPVTLIFVTAVLTGIGIFDDIAKFGGAGALVPITGFANAVVSPAIDTKAEGMVLGLGAKIFTIAGPVILYGTFASVLYGVVFYIIGLIT